MLCLSAQKTLTGEALRSFAKNLAITSSVVLALAILLFVLWKAPKWLTSSWQCCLDPKDLAALESSTRQTLVQALGGLALLAGLLFTWRNLRLTQKTSQETLRIAEDGKLTDRFSKGIEQLGSESVDIKLGGIYTLERIAKESKKDHWVIMEVLTAFVRKPYQAITFPGGDHNELHSIHVESVKSSWAAIQAALTVIGRRNLTLVTGDQGRIDIHGAILPGARLVSANLDGANLSESYLGLADFQQASLRNTNFSRANLDGANLKGVDLSGSNLSGAILSRANLDGANLKGVDLSGALLFDANLSGADLSGTDLSGIRFNGVNLKGANFLRASFGDMGSRDEAAIKHQFENAVMDETTRLPESVRKVLFN